MFAKIKSFFENGAVRIIEGLIIWVAGCDVVINAYNSVGMAKYITLSLGVLVLIEALITIIQGIKTK